MNMTGDDLEKARFPSTATELRPQVLIVGGGILGTITAALLAEMGIKVVLVRLSDHERPRADSLSNQVWIQSGLLYVADRVTAARLRGQGQLLHLKFGVPFPRDGGVFAFATESERGAFEAAAAKLSMSTLLGDFPNAELRLGPLFDPSLHLVRVPDTVFDEATIIETARTTANAHGAVLYDLSSPARLLVEHGRVIALVDDVRIAADVVVLAAGAATPALLTQVGEGGAMPLKVERSPLMIVRGTFGIGVRLFVNRSTGLTVAMHPPSPDIAEGCLVLGNGNRTALSLKTMEDVLAARELTEPEANSIIECIPEPLMRLINRPGVAWQFIAGLKTEVKGQGVREWCKTFENLSLVAAGPGKATLALATAEEQVVPAVLSLLGRAQATATSAASAGGGPAPSATLGTAGALEEWVERPEPPHADKYKNVNDLRPTSAPADDDSPAQIDLPGEPHE